MKKYEIIYADPPWSYKDTAAAGKRGAAFKYPLMSIKDICSLPVKDLAAEDCILFLWVTMPKLNECFEVINAWGFEYKTCAFVWVKTNRNTETKQLSFLAADSFDQFIGMGSWTRANAEICLLATRGKPKRYSASVKQIIYAPLQEHSRKPAETRQRIVELCGGGRAMLEMFARQKPEGWDVWGNEVKSDIVLAN